MQPLERYGGRGGHKCQKKDSGRRVRVLGEGLTPKGIKVWTWVGQGKKNMGGQAGYGIG